MKQNAFFSQPYHSLLYNLVIYFLTLRLSSLLRFLPLIITTIVMLAIPCWAQPNTLLTFSNINNNSMTSQMDKGHRVYLMGSFLFGGGGDEVFSGLYVAPLGGGGELGYEYRDSFLTHHLLLYGNIGYLLSPYTKQPKNTTEYEDPTDTIIQFMFQYSTTFLIWKNKNFGLQVGPGIHVYGDAWRYYDTGDNIIVYRNSWFMHTGWGLKTLFDWQPQPRHRLQTSLYIPLLVIGARPSYTMLTIEQEKAFNNGSWLYSLLPYPLFFSLHNLIHLNFRLDYEFAITPNWVFKTGYHGLLQYTGVPRKRLDLHSSLILGLAYLW